MSDQLGDKPAHLPVGSVQFAPETVRVLPDGTIGVRSGPTQPLGGQRPQILVEHLAFPSKVIHFEGDSTVEQHTRLGPVQALGRILWPDGSETHFKETLTPESIEVVRPLFAIVVAQLIERYRKLNEQTEQT
jgi:hypothetical protein